MAPAGDRFDSDCVVGTQFESSQPHHAVLHKQRFRGWARIDVGGDPAPRQREVIQLIELQRMPGALHRSGRRLL